MARAATKIARGLGRALLVLVLGVLGVTALAYAALCYSAVGRDFVRDAALEQANALFRGKLAARELSSLGVLGLGLRGVEVTDPSGVRVIEAESLVVEISPLALLFDREIHIERVALWRARIDLADLGAQRGVLAAFALREPGLREPEPAERSESPVVIVSSIELDRIAVRAELSDLGVVGAKDLAVRGSFALRGKARAQLASLRTKLVADQEEIGQIDSAAAHWVLDGEDSTLTLRGRIAHTALALDARSRLPNDPAFEQAPLNATLVLDAIDGETLRTLGQAQLALQLEQKVRAELKVSGTVQALEAELGLSTRAGDVAVLAKLIDRNQLAVHVQSQGVTPGLIWSTAPDQRVALDLASRVGLAKAPQSMPFELDLKSASLDGSPLPVVRAKGRVENDAVRDVILSAYGQGVTIELSGDASAQQLNVHGTVHARDFKLASASAAALDADLTAVGPPTAPRASIALCGTALRYEDFVVDQFALDALGGPDLYTVSLNGRAPDGQLKLEGRVRLQERAVQIDAAAEGALRTRRFVLNVKRARIGYDGSVEVERAQLDGLGQRARVRGRYGSSAKDELALDAQLDLTALTAALQLSTALQGKADLQLTARGTLARPQAELRVHGHDLGMRDPARERPTVDVDLDAALDVQHRELTAAANVTSGRDLDLSAQLVAHFEPRKAPWYRALLGSELEGKLALDALSTEWIERWLLEPLPMHGRALASATLAGTLERPELSLTTQAQLQPRERSDVYEIAIDAHYADAALDLGLGIRDEQGEWVRATAALTHPAQSIQRFVEPGAALAYEAAWSAELKMAPRALGASVLDAWMHEPLDPELASITLSADASVTHAPRTEPTGRVALRVVKPARGTNQLRTGLDVHACADQQLDVVLIAELKDHKADVHASLHGAKQALLEAVATAVIELEPALRGAGSVTVTDADAVLELSEIDLTALPQMCGLAQGRVSGRVDAKSLFATKPEISVQLKGTKLSLGSPLGIDLDLRASMTPSEAQANLVLHHGASRSTIMGRLPIRWRGSSFEALRDQPFEAKVVLDRLPVMALLPPSFAISRASGYLNGAVRADGTLANPNVGGRIEPENLALTVTGLAQPLHGIDGRISFSNRRVIVERLIARDREGSVTLKGSAELAENEDVNVKLVIAADSFPLRQQGQVAGELDAKIDVTARMTKHKTHVDIQLKDASAWLLGGELRKGISLDEHPDIIDPRAQSSADDEPPEDEVPPEPIEIALNAEDSFWVRREDFAVKLSTKLKLEIEDEKVSAIGPVQIHRGYLQMLGQTFEIGKQSKVQLDGGSPPDPVLDITASTVNRSSNKTISVHIGGRSSAPELEFFIDGAAATVGQAATEMFGGRGGGAANVAAEGEAKSFVAGMMAGVMAMSARRELGDIVPILMIEPGDDVSSSRVRAGFELDKLVPGFLEGVIRGVYVEGIFAGSSEEQKTGEKSGVQGGVLLELYLPHDLVTSGQYGPGETWSVDLGWEP